MHSRYTHLWLCEEGKLKNVKVMIILAGSRFLFPKLYSLLSVVSALLEIIKSGTSVLASRFPSKEAHWKWEIWRFVLLFTELFANWRISLKTCCSQLWDLENPILLKFHLFREFTEIGKQHDLHKVYFQRLLNIIFYYSRRLFLASSTTSPKQF